jgi:hypothetical protein
MLEVLVRATTKGISDLATIARSHEQRLPDLES